jgi:hypothetical protein
LYSKIGNAFRKFGSTDKIDWCGILTNFKSMKNAYVKKIIKDFKNDLPAMIFKCPLVGEFEMSNISVRNKLFQMMPVGNYEMKLDFFEVKSSFFVNVSMIFEQTLLPK